MSTIKSFKTVCIPFSESRLMSLDAPSMRINARAPSRNLLLLILVSKETKTLAKSSSQCYPFLNNSGPSASSVIDECGRPANAIKRMSGRPFNVNEIWADNERTVAVDREITKLVVQLNKFASDVKLRLAAMNQRLDNLDDRVDYLECAAQLKRT